MHDWAARTIVAPTHGRSPDARDRRPAAAFSGIVADNREKSPPHPACRGGEITIFSGASAAISSSVNASLRLTILPPQFAEVLIQIQ